MKTEKNIVWQPNMFRFHIIFYGFKTCFGIIQRLRTLFWVRFRHRKQEHSGYVKTALKVLSYTLKIGLDNFVGPLKYFQLNWYLCNWGSKIKFVVVTPQWS